jgi:hypothetical protein
VEVFRAARSAPQVPASEAATALRVIEADDERAQRAARRSLRAQIARLERELADAFVTAYRMGGLDQPTSAAGQPRLLDLGELERVRDELAERVRQARLTITERAAAQERKRLVLELMLLDPGAYRFTRISRQELGEPGCGVWQVRPRLGLIGMLMGWWQVKLSSGCPLAKGRRYVAATVTEVVPQLS